MFTSSYIRTNTKMSFIDQPSKIRKTRVGFNNEKDILLLRAAIDKNPWVRGDKQWHQVVEEIKDNFEADMTIRTARGRVDRLISKFKSNELKYKSGVAEEEESEVDDLVRSIIAIQEEEKAAKAAMNKKRAAVKNRTAKKVVTKVARMVPGEASEKIVGEISDNIEIEYIGFGDDENYPPPEVSATKQRRLERDEADAERQRYVDEAIGAGSSRPSRERLSKEEELVQQRLELDINIEKEKFKKFEAEQIRDMKRQEHEIQMEKSKHELEKKNSEEKLQLEKERLVLEKIRETRKEQESIRRDEIAKMSIEFQSNMIAIMAKFLEK